MLNHLFCLFFILKFLFPFLFFIFFLVFSFLLFFLSFLFLCLLLALLVGPAVPNGRDQLVESGGVSGGSVLDPIQSPAASIIFLYITSKYRLSCCLDCSPCDRVVHEKIRRCNFSFRLDDRIQHSIGPLGWWRSK